MNCWNCPSCNGIRKTRIKTQGKKQSGERIHFAWITSPIIIYLGETISNSFESVTISYGPSNLHLSWNFQHSNLPSKYPELCDNRTQWAGDLDKDLGPFTYRNDPSESLVTYKQYPPTVRFIDKTEPYWIQRLSTIQENLLHPVHDDRTVPFRLFSQLFDRRPRIWLSRVNDISVQHFRRKFVDNQWNIIIIFNKLRMRNINIKMEQYK